MKTEILFFINCTYCETKIEHLYVKLDKEPINLDEGFGFEFECSDCNSTTEANMELEFFEGDV